MSEADSDRGGESAADHGDFTTNPEYAAIFAATFKDLPAIQQIEKRWIEEGLQPGDPSRMDLELHALFDRRMEIIAGTMIAALRAQTAVFEEYQASHGDLAQHLQSNQQDAVALRDDLTKFVIAGSSIVESQRCLSVVLQESSDQITKAVKLCGHRSTAVMLLQVFIPMLAMSFGAVLALVIVLWKR